MPFEINFKANPRYFGRPKGKARIPNLKILTILETILQMEALISGKVDIIRSGCVDPEHVPFLEQTDHIKILSTGTLRVYFLCMDAKGRSGETPFRHKKVRQAINHAINRKGILKNAFYGFGAISDCVTSPLHFGYENDVARYPYDPVKARKLLVEAGYPNGFATDFYAIKNESACEKIMENLEAVGIRVNTKWMMEKWDQLYRKFLAGDIPLAFLTWGSYSIFDAGALMNHFFMADSPACYGTTPEIHNLLKQANASRNREERKKLFSEAQKKAAEKAFWVPICSAEVICAMQKDLRFQPTIDEIDRYFMASWPSN